MSSPIVPILHYQDANKAIEWLCEVIGFEVFLNVPDEHGGVKHARLVLGDCMIMLSSLGRGGEFDDHFVSPSSRLGVTQANSIQVDHPEPIYQRACASSARIVQEIEELQFGGKMFVFEDLEAHLWVITSHNPWLKTW